ncbi:hypothetical protein AKJ65_00160 [candidate division MSBL1 archaeon SCGC-AAA259E19]|uniref:Aminoacyl-transfer RNA synthetases class-II family profile domain-containing protein n=1 Tax=candidate division MSBL1 archaeon SCGC-AAA259E19 TaxID=1698264 RepID=A0A133UNU3_9EURY|nr:hypothetical protein AKJ65_00160 [candidate division MSBL1 archaeon SCGC-AAA259E19]
MKFDIDEIKKKARKNYERAWKESKDLIEKKSRFSPPSKKGSTHPLFDLVQEFRNLFVDLGFREVLVPVLVEKGEIRKQYGPQAPIILDRIFFLAGLDRSDLGISQEDLEKIREEVPDFDKLEELEKIFRGYKEGEISADDLSEVLVKKLEIEEDQASHILSLFEDFKELEPVPSSMTLRSHTTAGWFSVLQGMKDRESLPIQLFTVGPKYRREQELDETHLYRSWTASIVVMAEEIGQDDGEELAKKIMEKLGFEKIDCKTKEATSKYYAPGSEFEIFVEHPGTGEMVEVGNGGFYSPVSLANYDIQYPVFNLGVGLERVLMIRTGEKDIRELVYPYRYKELELSDEQIARMLKIKKKPATEPGKKLAEKIEQVARKYKDKPSPCEFEVSEGEIHGTEVLVKIVEPEEDTKLVGPAAFNFVHVVDGNIVGVPPEGWEENDFLQKARKEGISTGINYIKAFSNLAAREIEEAVDEGEDRVKIRVPIVESLTDINLNLERPARRYITNKNKRIDVRGPVFVTILADIG